MKDNMALKTMLSAGAALALVATSALAQDPAAPPAATQAAPAPAAEAAAPMAAPAAMAPVEAAPEVAAAPPEPPPVLPTSGDGAVIVKLLTQVCEPLVQKKGTFEQLVASVGLKEDRRNPGIFALPLSQRPFEITMLKPSAANASVCEMTVKYAPGWDQPIVDAMNVWRFLHTPQLTLQRNDIGNYKDIQRTTTTWDNWLNQGFDGAMIGLVLVQKNNLNGNPVFGNGYDEAVIQYSTRAALTTDQAHAAVASETPNPAPTPGG